MITVPQSDIRAASTWQSAATVPTPEQMAALKVYKDANPSRFTGDAVTDCRMCAERYQIPNPEKQGRVPRPAIANADLFNLLATTVEADGAPALLHIQAGQAAGGAVGAMCALVWATLQSQLPSVTLGTSQVAEIVQALVPAVVSQATADAILTEPDPAWQANVEMPSPYEQAGCPEGACWTIQEYEQAVA